MCVGAAVNIHSVRNGKSPTARWPAHHNVVLAIIFSEIIIFYFLLFHLLLDFLEKASNEVTYILLLYVIVG